MQEKLFNYICQHCIGGGVGGGGVTLKFWA